MYVTYVFVYTHVYFLCFENYLNVIANPKPSPGVTAPLYHIFYLLSTTKDRKRTYGKV